jgi:hypothetical protein
VTRRTPAANRDAAQFHHIVEKVPGTPIGNSIVVLSADLGCRHATLRSRWSTTSPSHQVQVVVNDDQAEPEENTDDLYPWKMARFK